MKTGIVVLALLTLGSYAAEARPGQARAGAVVPTPAGPVAVPAESGKAPRVQRLSFDDDIVDAKRDLGDGDILTEARKPKFPSLVRPRLDFIPELVKSADTF